ncbi:hypothetical protein BU26DRAFT_588611, partial [Trematosphaeria pertusa]
QLGGQIQELILNSKTPCPAFTASGTYNGPLDPHSLPGPLMISNTSTGTCIDPGCLNVHNTKKLALCKGLLFKNKCAELSFCRLSHQSTRKTHLTVFISFKSDAPKPRASLFMHMSSPRRWSVTHLDDSDSARTATAAGNFTSLNVQVTQTRASAPLAMNAI